MDIIYEINPPKIFYDSPIIDFDKLNQEIEKFLHRTKTILEHVNYIHITDSVLGIPRISSIHAASIILEHIKNKKTKISCSVRTRDRSINSIIQLVTKAVSLNIKDLLFILGDRPQVQSIPKVLQISSKPTDTINILNSFGYNKFINLYLSIPNKISNYDNFNKKINSNPYGMITQSINSLKEIKELYSLIKNHSIKLIPCVMVPSDKNIKAAKSIGLDWKEYKDNFSKFVEMIGQYSDNILVSSPNDFYGGIEMLKDLKDQKIISF
jgi:5,10-methylenetetrahydrofolate reductase